ncbi:MAG TPA: hypothetical protein DCP92_00785 [Nitrospiraceae bacterium]|jgi:predicted glycoside hydrolase/deacetylase ChbG (UPF0249 family)|nr:hypothetical protein [Nitrospiraceae bacterium]
MIKLIMHSDDFGLHAQINQAVIDAASKGVLSSASWMANGLAAEEALEAATAIPSLGIGIHLNIVRGRPLSDPAEIPSLVDARGRFFNSVGTLLRKSYLGQLRDEDIHVEYRRQVRRMIGKGLVPTHFDGEKHTHIILPGSRRAVEKLRKEFDVQKVRTISERKLHTMLAADGVSMSTSIRQHLKLIFLEHASSQARKCWKNMKTPDLFFGVLSSSRLNSAEGLEALRAILSLKISASVEWMLHPGYCDGLARPDFISEFGSFFLLDARAKEAEFLLSDQVQEEIARNRDKLISYRDL